MEFAKGLSKEQSKSRNLPGLYRHPDTGAEEILLEDPKLGSPAIDGYVRVGFVRVGDAPANYYTQELKRAAMPAEAPEQQSAPSVEGDLNIDEYSRKQLEAIALGAGVENTGDVKLFPNKQSVADAISAAKKGTE